LEFVPNPGVAEIAANSKALTNIQDPGREWSYSLAAASGAGFDFAPDSRPGYQDYGVLALQEGSHEIAIPFDATNARAGGTLEGLVKALVKGVA
jgi:hypothetical protein